MIAALIGVIVVAFALQVVMADPDRASVVHGLVPGFEGTESVLLAVGILGATVMPHVIYLHSALTQHRLVGATEEAKRRIFHFELVDVVIAMGLAGVINMSMLVIAASMFYDERPDRGRRQPDSGLREARGRSWATARRSSSRRPARVGALLVERGTMAGQVVMQGFVNRRIPLFLRRLVTMLPALVIIGVGVNPSRTLVISQVVLSFGIPFALVPSCSSAATGR